MTDMMDALRRMAFVQKVGHALGLGHEKPVGNRIGDQSVDFLRHGPVATAKARFDMRYREVQLFGDNRAGKR